jgi:hypothetical protein
MSIITTYPIIANIANEDLLIISDVSAVDNPTKMVSVSQLAGVLSPPTGISLSTIGTTGAAAIGGNILNIPVYQGALTLTTVGAIGAATLVGDTLNIPNYNSTPVVTASSSDLGIVKINTDVDQLVAANATSSVAGKTYGIQFNSSNQLVVNVPWTSAVTAALGTEGLVKLGSATVGVDATVATSVVSNRNYAVQLNTSDEMVVNVPWVGSIASTASSTVLGIGKLESDSVQAVAANAISSTASRTYGIQFNSTDQMVVNVPWVSTAAVASSSALGSAKVWSDIDQAVVPAGIFNASNRTYGIQFNASNQMVVNVPWVTGGISSLTTTGDTGPATLVGGVINVPNYIPYDRIYLILTIDTVSGDPVISTIYNTTAATFSVVKATTGKYSITATTNIFNLGFNSTHFSIMNSNILVPGGSGTGELPMPTVAKVKTSAIFGLWCYSNNTGSIAGQLTDLPATGGEPVTVEISIYQIPV